jgi:hypothetical protein
MLIGGVVVVCTDGGGLQAGGGELASDDGLHDGGELAAACVAVGKASRCSSARIVMVGATATLGSPSRASRAAPRQRRPEASTSSPTVAELSWADAGSAHGELLASGSARPRGRRGRGGALPS